MASLVVHLVIAHLAAAAFLPTSGSGIALEAPRGGVAIEVAGLSEAAPSPQDDSVSIHRDARRAQEDFERVREVRIPAEVRGGWPCEEIVGRICIIQRDGDPAPVPAAPRAVVEGRAELMDHLEEAARQLPGDDWIIGQLVRYRIEAGDIFAARYALDRCEATGWWCTALTGFVLHHDERWVEAGEVYRDAVAQMPHEERVRWAGKESGEMIMLDRDGRRFLDVEDAAERERRRALLWRLSDPLFLVPGNDRWTAHMARLTQVRMLEDSWNPFGLPWDVDLEEILLRYGWAIGWERGRAAPSMQEEELQGTRMIGRRDPQNLRYLPVSEVLAAFPATRDGALDVGSGRQATGYVPPYAPEIENLEGQTARFLRAGNLYVVHAFAPAPVEDDPEEVADDPAGGGGGARGLFGPVPDRGGAPDALQPRGLRTALFLLPAEGPITEDDPQPVEEGAELAGVWTATVERRDHLLSLEAWSRPESRAWRIRHGLPDLPRTDGRLAASDPVFLDPEAGPAPESLEGALEQVVPRIAYGSGELVRIAWELYGIPEGGIVSITLGVERAEQSLARRIGEFFRVLEPDDLGLIRWDDAEPEEPGDVFRAIDIQLPELDAGLYELLLEFRLGDDEIPAVSRRLFRVTEG